MTRIAHSVLLVLALTAPFLPVRAASQALNPPQHAGHEADVPPDLVREVRDATEVFKDVNQATALEYGSVLGCVSGPDAGAMGVHFVNEKYLKDETVDVSTPEALIYEFRDGIARLVGVEYIVFAEQWHKTHAENDPPVLEGQLMHRYESPNRFGLPSFYELHVWAWRDNPNGAFVDWNPRVSCEGR